MGSKTNLFGLAVLAVFCLCGAALAQWSEPVPVNEVNTALQEGWPVLSFDGLTLYFGRRVGNVMKVYEGTRSVPSEPFSSVREILRSTTHVIPAWVSPDNLRMYYHNEKGSGWVVQISERASEDDPWPTGTNVSELNALGMIADHCLTPDELVIVFTGNRLPGSMDVYDIWMASRTDRGFPFGNVRNLSELNTIAHEADPYITPDGLTLYFSSNRTGTGQIFRTSRSSIAEPFDDPEEVFIPGTPGAGQPALSVDGTTLYFVYDSDIYVSYLEEEDDGLVGHWKFDEGGGSVAYDSAEDNDGVVYGATWADGILGGSLDFDGDMDYVEIPDDDSLNPSSAISISWWVLNRGGQNAAILKYAYCPNESASPGRSRAFQFAHNEGAIALNILSATNTSDGISSEQSIPLNEWHHLAGTFDRGEAALYLDGSLVASETLSVSSIMNDVHPLIIGGCWSYCGTDHFVNYLNGLADDVRIYDRALSAGEVAELYGVEPGGGLVAHWKFDEAEGSIAYDSAGSNDGAVYGAQWIDGFVSGALEFDGVNDYVEVPDNDDLDGMSELTINMWVNPDSIAKYDTLIHKGGWGDSFVAHVGASRYEGIYWGTDAELGMRGHSPENLVIGEWQMLTLWFRGDDAWEIYINATLTGSNDALMSAIPASSYAVGIGHPIPVGGTYFDGRIDDVRIYDVALSAGEIEEIYGEVPAEPVGLVSHWRFDEGGGTIAYDSAGTNDGVIDGAQWATGVLGDALEFDGADDYVAVPDSPSLDIAGQITISAWAKPAAIPSGEYEQGGWGRWDHDAGETSYLVRTDDSGMWHGDIKTSTGQASVHGGTIALEWQHVVMSYDASKLRLFVNGTEADSSEISGPISPSNINMEIGRYDGVKCFDGVIDDVRLYDVALSAGEVLALYEEVPPVVVGESWHVDCVLGSDDNDGLSPQMAFFSIQKGIDSAEDGDSVLVWPGVYSEEVRFKGKAVTVRSAGDAATIENPDDFAVSFYYGEGPGSVLENFVIANSLTGIFIAGSSPTISNVTVVNNILGIEAYTGSEPAISNTILWDNIESDIYGCEAAYSWVQSDFGPAAPTEGLVAHWKFDEGEGETAYDSAGENHGTIYGATWSDGQLGEALNFDGADNYVEIPDSDALTPQSELTVSAWVNVNDISWGNRTAVVCKYYWVGDRAYLLQLGEHGEAGQNRVGMHVSQSREPHNGKVTYGTSSLQPGEWYHIAGTFEPDHQEIYINGIEEADDTDTEIADSIPNNGQPIHIGYHKDEETFFNGQIDDVRIYAKALSAEEIAGLYEGQTSGDPLFADPGAGDYHLRSERGRYWAEHGVWVLDDVSSPCIDGGNLEADYSAEREPNGGIINIGAFGGTYYASMSEWLICGDMNGDGVTNMVDFSLMAYNWLGRCGTPDGESWEPYKTGSLRAGMKR